MADLFIRGLPHSITARYFSSNPSDSGSLRTPCPPSACAAGRRGITPAFGYSTPHLSAGGTLTLLIHALPSAHSGISDCLNSRAMSHTSTIVSPPWAKLSIAGTPRTENRPRPRTRTAVEAWMHVSFHWKTGDSRSIFRACRNPIIDRANAARFTAVPRRWPQLVKSTALNALSAA